MKDVPFIHQVIMETGLKQPFALKKIYILTGRKKPLQQYYFLFPRMGIQFY